MLPLMGRPRTYDRAEVLRRATDLFVRKGYGGAHLQELVDVTGMNRFSLYKEFGGKEGLFQAALEAYLGQLSEVGALLRREPLGLANIRAFYGALLDQEFPHGCLAVNTIREKHVVPERVYATIQAYARTMESNLLSNLTAARKAGELPQERDVEGLAMFLTSVNMGLLTYGILGSGGTNPRRVLDTVDRLLE